MINFLILALTFYSGILGAQSTAEQAIILNQELQYLNDSIQNIDSLSSDATDMTQKNQTLNQPDLENTYFGVTEEDDSISSKASSSRRRGP